jgi:hypothetical protein
VILSSSTIGGWYNHRLESPLFVAALYNRYDVVKTLLDVIVPDDIQQEISHVNVEGASLASVANGAVRDLLGVPTDSIYRHEIVLVFEHRQSSFRKTVVDVLQEESAQAPSLVVTALGTAASFDYVGVGVTEDILAARAHSMRLLCRKRGTNSQDVFDVTRKHEFEPLRSLQRQEVHCVHVLASSLSFR